MKRPILRQRAHKRPFEPHASAGLRSGIGVVRRSLIDSTPIDVTLVTGERPTITLVMDSHTRLILGLTMT